MRHSAKALVGAVILLGAGLVSACGAASSGPSVTDSGPVAGLEDSIPFEADKDVIKPVDEAKSGWLSAPWALLAEPDDNQLRLTYLAGDGVCFGEGGLTVDEGSDKVTISAYVNPAADAPECPDPPTWITKFGTIELAQPLGDRSLEHAGIDSQFDSFSFSSQQ